MTRRGNGPAASSPDSDADSGAGTLIYITSRMTSSPCGGTSGGAAVTADAVQRPAHTTDPRIAKRTLASDFDAYTGNPRFFSPQGYGSPGAAPEIR